MKKRLAVLMTLALTCGLLAGCGGDGGESTGGGAAGGSAAGGSAAGTEAGGSGPDSGEADGAGGTAAADREEVDLTFVYIVSGTLAVQEMVNAEIARLAKEQLNVNLTVMPMTISEAMQQTSLMVAAGESIDVFPAWAMNIASFVDSGYVLDLADYVDGMPNTLQWVGKEDVECCNVGGYIWGVTTMRERCNPQGIEMRTDILNELGINPDDIKTLDDVTDVFAQVKENYPDMVILSGASTEGLGNAADMAYICDPLNDELGVLDNFGEELTVVNEFETEYWMDLVRTARKWYEAGYISKDMPTSTDSGMTLMMAGNLFAYNDNYKPNTEAEKKSQTGMDLSIIPITQPLSHTTSVCGLGYSVNGVSQHPDRAVELLDWIIGSPEVNDLMNFGVEGVHWVENEEGTASFPDGVDASNCGYHLDWGWAIPNQFAGHLWEGNDPDLYEQYQEWRAGAKKSAAYGFSFDSSPVTDEVIACKAVLDEYLPPITTGSVDPETAVAEMNQALYDAGLQTVMDEKQRQLDEWAAAQN